MLISIIAAIGKRRELGKDNKIPWRIPEDIRWFREKTRGHTVIMGRKTFESIGRPLPDRINIVVTSQKGYKAEGALVARSLEQAIDIARKQEKNGEIFIIGGAQIYKQAIGLADRLYLTKIDAEFPADAFFPDYSAFKKEIFRREASGVGYRYTFLILEKS
jgi:dihydrofolate reductase